jgi:ADP-ribosylglycohydrolase
MHDEKELAAHEDRMKGAFSPEIKVTRTITHNKRIATKGCVFFVASCKHANKLYTFYRMYNTSALTEEDETGIKAGLAAELKEHYKL